MSTLPDTDDRRARRLVEAAAWRVHLAETDSETHEDFEAWLAADPRNEAAWRQVQESWNLLGEQASAPELLELRRAALRDARNASRKRWRNASFSSRFVRRAFVAALLLAAVGAVLYWNASRAEVYRTVAGERRVVRLEDGSQIALDSRSEVRVRYTDDARDLTLLRGQARFDVAQDEAGRPFSVAAAGQRVVAMGTAFNVDLLGPSMRVTLIEGRVLVIPEESAPSPTALAAVSKVSTNESGAAETARAVPVNQRRRGIELRAGEQLEISPEAPPSIVPANIERATAWQQGRLVFEDEPLSSVVVRVSHYGDKRIRVVDGDVAEMRISGVFNAGDVDGFIATVTAYLPVDAWSAGDGTIELYHRR